MESKKTLHPSVDFLLQLNMVFQIPWHSPSLALLSNSSWGNPEVVPVQAKDIMCPVSSEVSSHLDMPGKPFKGGHPDQMPRPPQIHYSIGPTQ